MSYWEFLELSYGCSRTNERLLFSCLGMPVNLRDVAFS